MENKESSAINPYEVKTEVDICASKIFMPDGNTLADTIVSLRNRIYNLEKEVNSLKGRS